MVDWASQAACFWFRSMTSQFLGGHLIEVGRGMRILPCDQSLLPGHEVGQLPVVRMLAIRFFLGTGSPSWRSVISMGLGAKTAAGTWVIIMGAGDTDETGEGNDPSSSVLLGAMSSFEFITPAHPNCSGSKSPVVVDVGISKRFVPSR